MRKHFIRMGTLLLVLTLVCSLCLVGAYALHRGRRLAHEKEYSAIIERECIENNLDEALLRAVIYCESGYDANAVSSVGARGLMQLTEDTFNWISWRLGEDDIVSYDDIFDPALNIRYGAYLLRYLLDIFSDREETALAAYHAGVSCVRGWLSDTAYSTDGATLDSIPYKDTASYVSWVIKTKNRYYT